MVLSRRDAESRPLVIPITNRFEGNDGKWSTFYINVGDQDFRVLVSTMGSATWVPDHLGCSAADPGDCLARRGVESVGGAKSRGYAAQGAAEMIGMFNLVLATGDLAATYGEEYNLNGTYYKDIVGAGRTSPDSIMVASQAIASLTDKKLLLGSFGLAPAPYRVGNEDYRSFLSFLPNSTQPIPSHSYGYTAGASYREPPLYGSLVLGGYDGSRFNTSPNHFPMNKDGVSLDVFLQSIIVNTTTSYESITLDRDDTGDRFSAVIDSTLPYLWLPRSVCDRIQKIFSLTYNSATDLYTISDNAQRSNIQSRPSISFAVAANLTSSNVTTITLPYSAFVLQASWPIFNSSTNYFPIRRSPTNKFVLGRTFLQETYLTVDYERGLFSLAQALSNPGPLPEIIPILRPSSGTRGLSKSALAGIVVGVISGVLLLAIAGFCLWRRHIIKERQRQQQLRASNATVESEAPTAIANSSMLSFPTSEMPATPGPPPDVPLDMNGRRISELAGSEPDSDSYFRRHHRKVSSNGSTELGSPGTPVTEKSELRLWLQRHGRHASELSSESEIVQMPSNEDMERPQPQSPRQQSADWLRPGINRSGSSATQVSSLRAQSPQPHLAGGLRPGMDRRASTGTQVSSLRTQSPQPQLAGGVRPELDRRASAGTQTSRRPELGMEMETHDEHEEEESSATASSSSQRR